MRITKTPEERKSELIAAARRLFDERGVQKTRVSDIVKHVGVAQGVFYYYFRSKNEIVNEVIRQVDAEMEIQATAILADTQASFCQKISRFIELFLGLVDQFLADGETNLAALNLEETTKSGPAVRGSAILTEKLLRLVRQGAAEGQVPANFPEESLLVLLYGLRTLAGKRLPSREMIYTIAEQSLCLPKGQLLQYCNKQPPADMIGYSRPGTA